METTACNDVWTTLQPQKVERRSGGIGGSSFQAQVPWYGKPIAKTTLASANQNRDYRIFEDFAFYMMKEACEKRATNLLDIPGKKYAFFYTIYSSIKRFS